MFKKRNLIFFSLFILGVFLISGCWLIPAPTYTVTYNGNGSTGGSVPTDSTGYKENDTVTVLGKGDLVNTGYAFAGWNTQADGSGTDQAEGSTFIMGASDIMLYAKWTINTYTVTFDSQGGSAVDPQTVEHGRLANEPTAPRRTGRTFGGWYKESGCTNAWDFATDTVTSDVTLYAKWTINTYTVTFNSQGGSAVSSQTVKFGRKAAEPTDPTRTGYTFGGWYKESGCINPWNFDTDRVGSNMTLYAQWTINIYTVTFNSQGGSAVDPQTVEHGGLATEPTAPTKEGYTFGGWYKESGCTNSWNFDSDTVTSDVTLYAQWTINTYTVTFNKNGGDTEADPITKSATHGGNVGTLPTEPTRTGYIFTSWNTEANGSGTEFTAATAVTANLTVYAQWASSNATLSDLSLSSGTLNPSFASATTSYTASVENYVTSISVTPTATDTNATITVNGTPVASGSVSGAISLNVGENTITIVVTAEDGTTTKTYTVTVTRAASSAKAITAFDFKALDPDVVGVINEGAKTVILTVPFGTDVTALVPTIVHTGVGILPTSGTAQDFTSPVNYTVTAEDTSTQAYLVTVTVAAPVIATTSTIANGASAPSVTVTGTSFKAGIVAADLTVGVGTTGLILGIVSFVNATEITVAFTGTAAAGEVTIQAKTSAFDPASGLASNTLTITVALAVGDSYGGGIVAYILQPGEFNGVYNYDANVQHGLIAAKDDAPGYLAWSNITDTSVGTTGTAIGTGKTNTTTIVNQVVGETTCTSGAAYLCDQLDEEGYTDWFLPSKKELKKLYINRAKIGGFAFDVDYWSSSESNAAAAIAAWLQNFEFSTQYSTFKYVNGRVRAVRAF